MERSESGAYWALLALSVAFTIGAIVTLLPNPGASKPNVLGYRSVCSFAPAATALCGLLAAVTCTIRLRFFSRRASSARYRPLILHVGLGVILLVCAVVSGFRFGAAQSRFTAIIERTAAGPAALATWADGTRRASFEEGEVSASVEVSVRSGRISALKLVSGRNVDERLAAQLFPRVTDAGSTAVDSISGATASSRVLLKAVDAALSGRH